MAGLVSKDTVGNFMFLIRLDYAIRRFDLFHYASEESGMTNYNFRFQRRINVRKELFHFGFDVSAVSQVLYHNEPPAPNK
jgi:hypothetical protein